MSKLIRWVLYFAIAASFLAAQILTIDLGFFQLSLFRMAVLLLPVLVIVYLCAAKRNPLCLFPKGKRNFYSVCFMVVWFLYALISLAWTPDISNGIRILYFLGAGTLCSVLFSAFFDKKEYFPILFRCMLVMIIFQSLIGWYEIIFRNYHFLSEFNQTYYSSASQRIPIAMMGNPNDYALLMLFGVFIGYICYQCRRAKWEGMVSLFAAFSCCIHLLMSGSRACLLGLMMAAAMYAILLFKPSPKLLAALAGIAVGTALLLPDIRESLLSLLDFDFRPGHLNSVAVRLNLIRNGFCFLIQTWGFGTGVGGIEQSMMSAPYPTDGILNMHNWWMEIAAEFGILIFIGYLIFFCKLFVDLFHSARTSNEPMIRAISMGLLCCMTGFLISGISPSSVMPLEWLWVFWALAVAFHGYITSPADKPVDESPLIKKPAWIA